MNKKRNLLLEDFLDWIKDLVRYNNEK